MRSPLPRLVACTAALAAIAAGCGDDDERTPTAAAAGASATTTGTAAATPSPAPLSAGAELPRGGRSILPEFRVLAHYGAPQAEGLGILGIGTPAEAARRLRRQTRAYTAPGRVPVLPAMELIAAIANATPGPDGRYRTRQARQVIRRYLKAARSIQAILILDLQPGRSDFVTEARALEPFLREPDVSLAIDPEWRMVGDQVPGQVIGRVDAREINAVATYLSRLTRRYDLPDKLLVVHQFTDGMIRNRRLLRSRTGVDLVLNADGFGTRAGKTATYARVTRGRGRAFTGFKIFYEEDTGVMTPRDVFRLRPVPFVVIYE